MKRNFILILLIFIFAISACESNYTVDKRRGYYKIDFPEKKYQQFNDAGYPYQFEYPVYAKVLKDTSFFGNAPENPWWVNIDFPQFSARVFLSYKEIGKNKFDSLISDAFVMSYKQHATKASSIEALPIKTPNQIEGIYFSLKGNTATANQFFLTDSVKHFLRGALYFDATPNEDSLIVVNEFLKKDLQHLINSLQWNK